MAVSLYTTVGDAAPLVRAFVLNHDGRSDGPLYDNSTLKTGTYRLVFDVAGYFAAKGVVLPEPNFLGKVSLDFGVAQTDQHYHVPLLVSPWSYSTYRGSSAYPQASRTACRYSYHLAGGTTSGLAKPVPRCLLEGEMCLVRRMDGRK